MYMCFKHGSSIFFISDYAAGGPFDKFLRFNCKIYLIRLEEERTKMRVYVLAITNEKNILIFLSLSYFVFVFKNMDAFLIARFLQMNLFVCVCFVFGNRNCRSKLSV